MAQDTQGNLWILKFYDVFNDETTVLGGTDLKSMFMPAAPDVGDQPGRFRSCRGLLAAAAGTVSPVFARSRYRPGGSSRFGIRETGLQHTRTGTSPGIDVGR